MTLGSFRDSLLWPVVACLAVWLLAGPAQCAVSITYSAITDREIRPLPPLPALGPAGSSFKNPKDSWDTLHGNLSSDGRWFTFTSNWDQTLGKTAHGESRQDVFLVALKVEN